MLLRTARKDDRDDKKRHFEVFHLAVVLSSPKKAFWGAITALLLISFYDCESLVTEGRVPVVKVPSFAALQD